MLRQRLRVTALYAPVILLLIWLGGWIFAGGVALALALAGYEYWAINQREGLRPSRLLILAGVVAIVLARRILGFGRAPELLTSILIVTMTWHVVDYERGAGRSGTDFALTLAGILYLGWLGAYFVSLRDAQGGMWWVLVALPTVWLADGGAYLVGSKLGRRRMTPRLSPKKSWEGYLAGLLLGTLGATGLAALYTNLALPGSGITLGTGLAVGLVVSALAPIGDLGASMIKRELQIKDTGTLFPGHGGAFDRLDTWLWAGTLAFYVTQWLGA